LQPSHRQRARRDDQVTNTEEQRQQVARAHLAALRSALEQAREFRSWPTNSTHTLDTSGTIRIHSMPRSIISWIIP